MKFVQVLSATTLALCVSMSAFASGGTGATAQSDLTTYGPSVATAAQNVTTYQNDITAACNSKVTTATGSVALKDAVTAINNHCTGSAAGCTDAMDNGKTLKQNCGW